MENEENAGHNSPGKPFLLRPSALASPAAFGSSLLHTNTSSLLRPSKLSEIADKIENSSADTKKRKAEENTNDASVKKDESELKKTKIEEDSKDDTTSTLKLNSEVTKPEGIGSFGFGNKSDTDKESNSAEKVSKNATSASFIFGQNINARVSGFQEITKTKEEKVEQDVEVGEIAKLADDELEKHLVQNATEHMKREELTKLHLKEVEVITGEEGERNVLQIQCKIHLFNKEDKTWIEKGRGTLKLNDICQSEKHGVFQSRIVFRTQGSHLVVLNTFLWPEMCYEKASVKNLRITALNPETKKINVYLISAPSKDILLIHTAIDRRITALKRNKVEGTRSLVQHDQSCTKEDKDLQEECSSSGDTTQRNKAAETKEQCTDSESAVVSASENPDLDNSNGSSGIDT